MRHASRLSAALCGPRRLLTCSRSRPLSSLFLGTTRIAPHAKFSTTTTPSNSSTTTPATPSFTPKQLLANPSLASALPYPVVLPTYDRSTLTPGIVHLGLGAFPRAHLAYYIDALLHTAHPASRQWGISGVAVRAGDKSISDVLKAQDGLYTVVGRGGADSDVEVRVVGSVLEFIYAPDEPRRLLDRLLAPDTKVVSLTVTEGGYESEKNPEIDDDSNNYHLLQQHLTPTQHNTTQQWPRSVFGWIVLGLDGRRRLGLPAYSVLSMDNVQLNGLITKRCLLHIARPLAELSAFITDSVVCPSSMVDRITPVTTAEQAGYVKRVYGIDDRWPLLPEQWTQWVLEDEPTRPFTAGRPPLELLASASSTADSDTSDDTVGTDRYNVLIVHDVAPYEHMKLRLLNASHSGICYLGYLCGYTYIHEVMSDKTFVTHMRRFMDDEVTATLPPVSNINLKRYKRMLIERFANANIRDTVTRICQNGSNKWPRFLLPTLQHQLQVAHSNDVDITRTVALHQSALIVAAWLRWLDGVDESGQPIEIVDGTAEQLGLTALAAQNSSKSGNKGRSVSAKRLLEVAGDVVFGDVWRHDKFVSEVQRALDMLYEIGAKATLQRWLDEGEVRKAHTA